MRMYSYEDFEDAGMDLQDFEDGGFNNNIESDERIQLDDPESIEDDDEETVPQGKTLISVLRSELRKPECDRGSIDFRYDGKDYEDCVPMLEINPNKFVFKLEKEGNKMKSFFLSNISL